VAGQVRSQRDRRSPGPTGWRSTERGISVVASVTFETGGHVFNLLDTPGHEDFSGTPTAR
jgi:peptide chain release factor 3